MYSFVNQTKIVQMHFSDCVHTVLVLNLHRSPCVNMSVFLCVYGQSSNMLNLHVVICFIHIVTNPIICM